MLAAAKKFAFTILGEEILKESENVLDFKKIVENEVWLQTKRSQKKIIFGLLILSKTKIKD